MKRIFVYIILVGCIVGPMKGRVNPQLFDKIKGSVFPVTITQEEPSQSEGTYYSISSYAETPFIPQPQSKQISQPLGGTGFILDIEGQNYVITNAQISLPENSKIVAVINYEPHELKLIGTDHVHDISILTFADSVFANSLSPLPVSPLPVFKDQPVYTVAAPADYISHYISRGAISPINTNNEAFSGKMGYLLHAARLIDGCNGSPIINEFGEVVGMNTQFQAGNLSQTVVALESRTLKQLTKKILKNKGSVERVFLGLEFGQENFGNSIRLPMIAGIIPDGPADGIFTKNLNCYITHVNDKPIENLQQLLSLLEDLKLGSSVSFRIAKDFRGFGIDTVTIIPDILNEENLGKIGSYYVTHNELVRGNSQKDSNGIILTSEDNGIPNGAFFQVETLSELGNALRLSASRKVLGQLNQKTFEKKNEEFVNSYQIDTMNSLYY